MPVEQVTPEKPTEKPTTPPPIARDSIISRLLANEVNPNEAAKPSRNESIEYPGYDGWYNNLGKPELGAVDTPLLRSSPAAYGDGVYELAGQNRPNPLELSEQLLSGPIGSKSRTGKNALLVFFGQHVVEEILDAQRPACPPEYINIKIPSNHPYRTSSNHTVMPVLRTRYDERTGQSPNNPRQQLNEITPFLDGGLIYGTTKSWSDYLRLDANNKLVDDGLLAFSLGGQYPEENKVRLPMFNPPPPSRHEEYVRQHSLENVDRFFKLGNPRGNENPFLLSFGVVWFRWHNAIAKNLKLQNPGWSGEKIYNEARKWVIASQQSIVVYEWLPQWLGEELTDYKGYNPAVDPQIEQFFQSAAFRFGHTLVPAGVYRKEAGREGCALRGYMGKAIRTCNNFWLTKNKLRQGGQTIDGHIIIEDLLRGMVVQLTEAEDHKIVDDLRKSVFGPLEFSRRDLMALNIQRARDHGIPDYNTVRKFYKLHPVKSWFHFVRVNSTIRKTLKELYKNKFYDIDLWVGGIMETEDGPGELFKRIIADQFERIRNGDRFWFENESNGLFTHDEINRLRKLSFRDILISVTDIDEEDLPRNVFRVPTSDTEIHPNCSKLVTRGECEHLNGTSIPCWHAPPVDASRTEECTPLGSYDYFENSELSYMLTFISTAVFFGSFLLLILVKLFRLHHVNDKIRSKLANAPSAEDSANMHMAYEWIGFSSSNRCVIVHLNRTSKQIQVKNTLGHLTRALDLRACEKVLMFIGHESHYLLLRVEHNYDLVLKFASIYLRNTFVVTLERFLIDIGVERETIARITTIAVLKQAVTMKVRQKKLEQFFRVVFSQAFNIAHSEDEILRIDSEVAKEVIHTELTILEFAEALTMRADSEFVRKMFNLIDTDKNGFISFREFIDMLVLFLKGTAEDKLKLMFDMYDINGLGHLKREDFAHMLRSFMDTVNADISDDKLDSLIHSMMEEAQLAGKETIDLLDFKNILGEFNDKLSYAELEFNVNAEGTSKKLHAGKTTVKSKFIGEVKRTVEGLYADPKDLRMRVGGRSTDANEPIDSMADNLDIVKSVKAHDSRWHPVMKFVANKQLEIFWVVLYTILLFGIFAERFHYYTFLREHNGLRQITSFGVSVTRGAASAMMFAFSSLLITMCHNIITILRDTVLQFYIPFDSAIEMHKYIACWALIFTLIHVIGHGFNFYYISTQPADDLTCLFRNYFHASHELPKFQYWIWGTMTGITAMLLTLVTGIIFLCSLPVVRRKIYKWFDYGHCLYPVFFILMILHGSGRLVQGPYFHYFFIGPVVLFTIDKIFTATRKTIEIPLLKVEILPSNVTCLIFQKPLHFQYKPGQWVRISCPALNTNEYHPFTLSSAPHESTLSVHIRSVGPWTINMRNKLDPARKELSELPKIHVDGPYGESHQNWNKYNLSIMIASGIGVTPFASILKDIVHKTNQHWNLGNRKIYFIWVTQTQKQFEWMVDILREVENVDVKHVVSVHIFITQFYQKFDLRTILLYICERHFQKISNKSLFTGLRAVTHFGRPDFSQFLLAIDRMHKDSNTVGVFSCGSPTVVRAVDNACQSINSRPDTQTLFQHHYKSF
ncbi:dual oxidase [Diachasma alloeum]|uniref:dual oxidase n=1 Tax=Diachasma alloeum TaxID=454923 RepID=UPI00073824C2|nr:dual oxidase [Diachasma alloeum]